MLAFQLFLLISDLIQFLFKDFYLFLQCCVLHLPKSLKFLNLLAVLFAISLQLFIFEVNGVGLALVLLMKVSDLYSQLRNGGLERIEILVSIDQGLKLILRKVFIRQSDDLFTLAHFFFFGNDHQQLLDRFLVCLVIKLTGFKLFLQQFVADFQT